MSGDPWLAFCFLKYALKGKLDDPHGWLPFAEQKIALEIITLRFSGGGPSNVMPTGLFFGAGQISPIGFSY